jgi:hypothetical protein
MDIRSVLDGVRIVHFTDERIADPLAAREDLSWQAYHTARNAIVRACRRHGRTGPMGERPITQGEPVRGDWEIGDDDPAVYVIDDQLNYERYIYLETLDATLIGPPLVADLIATLGNLPGWGLGVNDVRDGYLLLFATHVLVHGPAFARANDIDAVIRVWKRAVQTG